MAYTSPVRVSCTNKLCSYTGTVNLFNGNHIHGKIECPRCGFKTLSDEPTIPKGSLDDVSLDQLRLSLARGITKAMSR